MTEPGWEEIHGFSSPGEYERFLEYIQEQIRTGRVQEIPIDPSYGPVLLFGGRWLRHSSSGEVWRLIPPDPPFYGVWEPVRGAS